MIAVEIGSIIATAVPNASVRITTATPMPIASLTCVDGFETSWPRYPPASTWIPAFTAGSAAAMMSFASSSSRSAEEMPSVTAM